MCATQHVVPGISVLAAARRLGKEFARIRTGEDEPKTGGFPPRGPGRDFALRVRRRSKSLAVDLCKLALWLEGHWAGKPLSFLDHRIRCGNSLVGVSTRRYWQPEFQMTRLPL